MSHEILVVIAKVFGPIWMMGFFLIVILRTYSPRRRSAYEQVARSVLEDTGPEEPR